jgi:hypothetical protein
LDGAGDTFLAPDGGSMATDVDRHDPNEAAAILEEILSNAGAVRFVANLLARSIRAAHAEAPSSWEVSLFRSKVRLNVGQVEVATIRDAKLELLVRGPLLVEDHRIELDLSDEPYYSSVPISSGKAIVPVEVMDRPHTALLAAHQDYVREAARRKRGSPFRGAHSPGVVSFIEALLGVDLPRPAYDVAQSTLHLPEEVLESGEYVEGATKSVVVNAFERSASARAACIDHYGARCVVCSFAFADHYGDSLAGYIHVHHLVPLSEVRAEYCVDPVRDLRPVCPNCHAVIHSRVPPLTIEEVVELMRRGAPA